MSKEYIIERHAFGTTVKVYEGLTKQKAEELLFELNHDDQAPNVKYSAKAVRKRG